MSKVPYMYTVIPVLPPYSICKFHHTDLVRQNISCQDFIPYKYSNAYNTKSEYWPSSCSKYKQKFSHGDSLLIISHGSDGRKWKELEGSRSLVENEEFLNFSDRLWPVVSPSLLLDRLLFLLLFDLLECWLKVRLEILRDKQKTQVNLNIWSTLTYG